jgi:hypothetical protein
MGILSGLLGNASSVDVADVETSLARILIPGEEVHRAYRIIRDLFIFTGKRLILVDRQGVSGHKTSYLTIPYKQIRLFSVETAGTFELDSDLKIWVAGMAAPLEKKFPRGETIYEVQMALAHYVTH